MFQVFFQRKRSEEMMIKNFFIKNGASVLEQVIYTVNGDCNPIRSYSTEELIEATSNYSCEIDNNWPNYNVYKGNIHNYHEICVKRFGVHLSSKQDLIGNEIAIASKMSNHKNSLKLLGYCLETELPLVLYEFPENGKLENYIYDDNNNDTKSQLSWQQKLRILIGIADGIAYLHHGMGKTFIHRHIKPSKFFLDENLLPKLSDFQLAIAIPEGQTHVDVHEVVGTFGYIAPEVGLLGFYTEKSDVFSFGVLFCQVITGKRLNDLQILNSSSAIEINLRERVEEHCKDILQEERVKIQLMECSKLARKCLEENPDDRPNMIDVGKTLRIIKNM